MKNIILAVFFLAVIQGCAAKSTFNSPQDGVHLTVGKTDIKGSLPLTGEIDRTTFGRYPMMVTKDGYDPLYCNVPLKVGAGYLVADIMFFAPAAFFNASGSLPYYFINLEERSIKYRYEEAEQWVDYPITKAESESVKKWFTERSQK